jgi:hypothetical protein
MKTVISNLRYKMFMLVMMVLSTVYAFAQDVSSSHTAVSSSSTTTAPDTTEMWYNAPWVWIVGAGVVLLLLLLLIRGGRSSDSSRRVTRTTTTTVRTE